MSTSDDLVLTIKNRLLRKGPRTWMGAQNPALERNEVYPPAGDEEIREAEGLIGMKLPPLVRRVYAEVANGGFGPGYGLWGLISGQQDDGDSIVSRYVSYTQIADGGYANWKWPRSRIVVAHWGCAIVSCLDLSTPDAPVFRFDPDGFISVDVAKEVGEAPTESLDEFFTPEAPSFESWMRAWLDGTLPF